MDNKRKILLKQKFKELKFKNYFKKFSSISFINFECENSIWYKKFYNEWKKYNNIYRIPDVVKPLSLTKNEIIVWLLEYLAVFNEETEFLIPVNDRLANINVKSFEKAISELWKPYFNLGVDIIMASKKQKKMFHIFETEYEYEIYISTL